MNTLMRDGRGKPTCKESMLETLYRDIEARYKTEVVAVDTKLDSRGWKGVMLAKFTLKGGKTIDAEHEFYWAQ